MTKKTKIILLCAIIAVLAAAVITTVSCISCGKQNEPPDTPSSPTVSLNLNVYQMAEDEIFTLVATATTADTIRWTSSDPAVASVSAQGRVIAKSAGEAVITATAGDLSDTCRITVVKDSKANTVIAIDQPTLRFSRDGGARRIGGTVTTTDGQRTLSDAGAVYQSEDTMVATVTSDGTVTPVSVGTTNVLVTVAGRTKTVVVEVYTMLVGTADDWNAMLALPGDPGARFYVTDDIDFSDREYRVKKTTDNGKARLSESMTGTLDGGGHTIRNITFDKKYTEQSLFGTIIGFTLRNIAFENVHFTAGNAAGIANRMIQHYDETDIYGNYTGNMVFAANTVSDVYADLVFESHGACGIAGIYYGGGIEDVFVNMRMADGSAMNPKVDFAVARQSMVWWSNNYINHLVVLSEAGSLGRDWDTTYNGENNSVDLSMLYLCTGKMEAGYYVRTTFDMTVWTVAPGQLPALR